MRVVSSGGLKTADMGLFQITAKNSSEDYSWCGSFNTSSRRKTANITMRLEYKIDYRNRDLSKFNHSKVELEKIFSLSCIDKSLSSMNLPISKSPRGKG